MYMEEFFDVNVVSLSLINIGIPEKFLPSAAKEMTFLIAKETSWVPYVVRKRLKLKLNMKS